MFPVVSFYLRQAEEVQRNVISALRVDAVRPPVQPGASGHDHIWRVTAHEIM